jgi:hypothetical protein
MVADPDGPAGWLPGCRAFWHTPDFKGLVGLGQLIACMLFVAAVLVACLADAAYFAAFIVTYTLIISNKLEKLTDTRTDGIPTDVGESLPRQFPPIPVPMRPQVAIS